MAAYIKDSGLEIKGGVMEYVFGQMVASTKELGKMTSKTATVFFPRQMVIFTKDKSKMANHTEKAN